MVCVGRLIGIGSSSSGLCRSLVSPFHQIPFGALLVGLADVSKLSSIISVVPSWYSILVVL